jgi:hypothetical protein
MRTYVQERVEARIVPPHGFVAFGMREDGDQSGAAQVEEAVLRSIRETSRSKFHEHGPARVGKSLPAYETPEYDVVEEVFARQVHDGKACTRLQHRAHGSERAFDGGFVVIEHPWPHVRRSNDGVKANAVQTVQHGQPLFGRARPIVDRRDPMAVQVDEPSHTT